MDLSLKSGWRGSWYSRDWVTDSRTTVNFKITWAGSSAALVFGSANQHHPGNIKIQIPDFIRNCDSVRETRAPQATLVIGQVWEIYQILAGIPHLTAPSHHQLNGFRCVQALPSAPLSPLTLGSRLSSLSLGSGYTLSLFSCLPESPASHSRMAVTGVTKDCRVTKSKG